MNPTARLKIGSLNMTCSGGGEIVGFYLHSQNNYFERELFVVVASFLHSVKQYFNGQALFLKITELKRWLRGMESRLCL